jgi:anaerobic ribonucleoside-triphosphate reductase
MLHAVKWLESAQTNFAGGQGFYNFLKFIAPYLRRKSYDEIKQLMQMFVYEMMQMYCARGGQVVFSSVQLSPGVPKIWRDKPVIYNGRRYTNRSYSEFEREVRLAFSALMEVMLEGDAQGKPFAFPKPELLSNHALLRSTNESKNLTTLTLSFRLTTNFTLMHLNWRQSSGRLTLTTCSLSTEELAKESPIINAMPIRSQLRPKMIRRLKTS